MSSESDTIRVGQQQTSTYIAGISGATSAGGVAVYVDAEGKLGTVTSSRRYKQQIEDMDAESDVLMKLRPVSFYYRPELDETHTRQYGLVAEEVAEVVPDLVAYDKDGAPQTVRYHFVNAMLLNEVQKQRRQLESPRRADAGSGRRDPRAEGTTGKAGGQAGAVTTRQVRRASALGLWSGAGASWAGCSPRAGPACVRRSVTARRAECAPQSSSPLAWRHSGWLSHRRAELRQWSEVRP